MSAARRLAPLLLGPALACSRGPGPSPQPAMSATAGGPASAATAGASAVAPTPPPRPRVEGVLLLTVDALRADLSFNGYSRATTPRLAELAARSAVYTRAYALSSYTSMSLAGLMTGRHPLELDRDGRATSSFGASELFLAEVLSEAGVPTLGVHGHVYFQGDTGIRQGFRHWRVLPRIVLNPAREGFVSDAALADQLILGLGELEREAPSGRFFAWAHFMDPHYAYARHEEGPRFDARVEGPGTTPLGPPLKEHGQRQRDRYDGEVAWTDRQLGRVLDWVRTRPWAERVAVVVTADHGEAFGEHGTYHEHGFLLYDVTVRVPLLVHAPGVAPARLETPRSHLDLARTLLELMGVPAPARFRGVSLVPELAGERPPARPILVDMPWTDQTPRRRALLSGAHKLIVSENSLVPGLFDVVTDPAEQRDLATSEPRLRARLEAELRELEAGLPDFPAPRRTRRQY